MQQAELVARIESFELDDSASADPFSLRLARENGWSHEFSLRVLREYQRFLALAVAAGHVVTPSEQVDQAWHLHLLYSAHYRRFCRNVLGRRLDHAPSVGGDAERTRYVRAYEQTLASYLQQFGEAPPADIWPSTERRFGADLAARRVNLAEYWLLPKPWSWLTRRLDGAPTGVAGTLLVGTGLLSFGCASEAQGLSISVSGSTFLTGYVCFWTLFLVAAYTVRHTEEPAAAAETLVLEPYSLAQLARGSTVTLHAAITSLLARELLELDASGKTLLVKAALPSDAQPFEQAVYAQVERAGELDVDLLRERAEDLTSGLSARLAALGMTLRPGSWLPACLALALPLVGAGRILSRVGTDKPVGWLVVLCIVGVFVAYRLRPAERRSSQGEQALAAARERYAGLRTAAPAAELANAGVLPISLAVFGLGAVALSALPIWGEALKQRMASASSGCGGGGCGAGGGCGGGGCGGGCGGCGGCGGE